MDCQMPEMDGFDATAAIRQLSGARCQIPVIAMTANAMAGDRERCLAAGMNDYIAKPVMEKELQATLLRWVAPRSSDVAESPAPARPVQPAVDVTALEELRRIGGDDGADMSGEVIALYLRDAPSLRAAMRTALAAGDAVALRRAAVMPTPNVLQAWATRMPSSSTLLATSTLNSAENSLLLTVSPLVMCNHDLTGCPGTLNHYKHRPLPDPCSLRAFLTRHSRNHRRSNERGRIYFSPGKISPL